MILESSDSLLGPLVGLGIIVALILPFVISYGIRRMKASMGIIPAEYKIFPTPGWKMYVYQKSKGKTYHRVSLFYRGVPSYEIESYRSIIVSAGYVQGSPVRYDKDNTYIIIESGEKDLKVVFHVKQ